MSRASLVVALALSIVTSSSLALCDERIILAVGNNIGAPGEEPLRFAESDAQRVRDLFVGLGDSCRASAADWPCELE